MLSRKDQRRLWYVGVALLQAAIFSLWSKIESGRSRDAGDLDRSRWSDDAGPVNNGSQDEGGARNRRDSNPNDSPLTHLLADRQKRLKTRRTMSDVVELGLRHLY